MNEQFKKRLLSFIWRLGNVMAIAGLAFITNNIGDLQIPAWAIGLVSLMTAEATKYLNTK